MAAPGVLRLMRQDRVELRLRPLPPVVLKLNRAGGMLNSVSTTPLRHWHGSSTKVEIERVKDYRAPGPGDTEKVKAATKLPTLCNYPGEGFAQMTQAEWDKKHKDTKPLAPSIRPQPMRGIGYVML